jgi:general secretion pathway protein L
MSTLIIQLPAQQRLSSDPAALEAAGGGSSVSSVSREYFYVLTANGQSVARQGVSPANMLPEADTVIAVMAPTDISWHQLVLPKAPAARLRQALGALLEEHLLEDPEDVHIAVAPGARAGEPTWLAVCKHQALTAHLMALEKAKVRVGVVVPAVWPDAPATGYFHELHDTHADVAESERGIELMLTWSTTEGVATWPLSGSLSRGLLPDPMPSGTRFFSTPAAAAPAERWLGQVVTTQTQSEHLLQASRSLWNLLQFELTPNSKGLQAATDQWKRFLSPQWRAARLGLAALVATQIVGLNLWAWHQQREVKLKKADMVTVLKAAHPQVQAVLDAPLQMRRETDTLRAQAGQPGENDMDALMQAVAAAWMGDAAVRGMTYDGNALVVILPAEWGPSQADQVRTRLLNAGYTVDQADGQLTVRRAGRS